MYLLVGLGNPGTEYAETRHNVGFMAVDELIHRFSFDVAKDKLKGQLTIGTIGDEKVLILKPMTFMNASGESVLAVSTFYKIKPEQIIVFHDDMDLPVGKIKVKRGGSSAGHNGLKSIDSRIGPNYMRVRIGTGKPQNKADVVDWVLTRFSKDDKKIIDSKLFKIAEEIELLFQNNEQTFMNKLVG